MFKLDQKGVSLPLVLAVMALVVANTFYFMQLDQSTKEQNFKRTAEIDDNSEKIRLATFLSDSSVCSSTTNFGLKTIAAINAASPSTPLQKTGIPFLTMGSLYSRGSLQANNYKFIVTSPLLSIETRYSLSVSYTIIKSASKGLINKQKEIRLPITLTYNGSGAITNCYVENNRNFDTVSAVVTESCYGNTAKLIPGSLPECDHYIIDQKCGDPIVGKVLNGVTADTNNKQVFTCGIPSNINGTSGNTKCDATPIQQLVTQIKDNDSIVCKVPEPGCAAGAMLVMDSSGAPVCANTCAIGRLFNSVAQTGAATCYDRLAPCPNPGEYAKEIKADGTPTCAKYSLTSTTCTTSEFATDMDPNGTTDTLKLGCRSFTKSKTCGSSNNFTFVQSFADAEIPTCTTYNN